MRLIHTADLHIGKSRKLPGYLERQDQMLRGIFRAAQKHSDGLVVIAGDVYDRVDLFPREKDLFIEHLCQADRDGLTTIVISGNHDMIDEDDGGYTHLRSLKKVAETRRLRRTHVVETDPTTITPVAFPGLTVVCVPSHYRQTKEVNQIITTQLKAHPSTKNVLAVVHETIYGAKNDFGKRIGIDIGSADHCVKLDGSLPVTYWALGDIHRPQRIKGTRNAWYSGSPIQHDYGDATDRGVLLVDLDRPEEPELLELPVKKLVTVKVDETTKAEDIPTDAHVRLDGERDVVRTLQKQVPNVVATKPTPKKEAEIINDVKLDDVLAGLPEILAEMGLSEDDQRWCLEEAERLR